MEKIIDEKKQGTALVLEEKQGNTRKLFIESYGCQMNFSDSEIVASILADQGFDTTKNLEDADLVLVNFLIPFGSEASLKTQPNQPHRGDPSLRGGGEGVEGPSPAPGTIHIYIYIHIYVYRYVCTYVCIDR